MSFFLDIAKKVNRPSRETRRERETGSHSHTVKQKKATKEERRSRKRIHSSRRRDPPSLPFKIIEAKIAIKRDRIIDGLLIPAGVTGVFYRIPVNLCSCMCLLGEHSGLELKCSNHPDCGKFRRATEVDCRRMLRQLKKR